VPQILKSSHPETPLKRPSAKVYPSLNSPNAKILPYGKGHFVDTPHKTIRPHTSVSEEAQPTQERNNMAEMKNWNEFSTTVNSFLEGGSVDKMTASTCRTLLGKGDNNVTAQTKVSSAIKTMLEDFDGAPVGRASALSGAALTSFVGASKEIEAIASVFDAHPSIRGLILPHGRSKDAVFDDGNAWVAFIVAQMRRNAISASKAGWDGSPDTLVSFLQEGN